MSAEERIVELGLELPNPPTPAGTYVPTVAHDGLLFVSGHGPLRADGTLVTGKVGADMDIDGAYEAARVCGLALLATLRANLGSLDEVSRVVKVLGMVNATPDFDQHPAVINGLSDLMVEVFGEAGRHTRSAVGMGSLPFGIAVEAEMLVAT